MRACVPIIPVAGLGIDHTYHGLLRERWLGRHMFGAPRYDLSIGIGALGTLVPRRAPHRFIVCPPVDPEGDPDDVELGAVFARATAEVPAAR